MPPRKRPSAAEQEPLPVVCRPRVTDQRRGRVVLVDEHRTSRVSSAVNGQQPCERQLNKRRATRPAGWNPNPNPKLRLHARCERVGTAEVRVMREGGGLAALMVMCGVDPGCAWLWAALPIGEVGRTALSSLLSIRQPSGDRHTAPPGAPWGTAQLPGCGASAAPVLGPLQPNNARSEGLNGTPSADRCARGRIPP
ncbi:hypothetical protein HaLaN_07644 [Haematococcus lacustris]|uniref:Uncharacterized protein n=1 Tax=Haematococcus lacustris TaxID=44745 RepID=A0A699YRY3_HAELA|nr:hypothetical protein HaLaN_07644 [Haematococcus lacustris]